jgi:hypothetical protein
MVIDRSETDRYIGVMAGKELDPARRQAAVAVVRQHPGLVAMLAAPALVIAVVAWLVGGAGWGLLALLVLGGLGAVALSRLLRRR